MEQRTLLRLDKVMDRTGMPRSTIYRKISLGEFPPPIKLGERAIAWPSDQVSAWIEKTIQQGGSK